MPVFSLRPNGDGSVSNWVGSYIDVDDDPDSPNDSDFVVSKFPPQANYIYFNLDSPSDYASPTSVVVRARVKGLDLTPVRLLAQLYAANGLTPLSYVGETWVDSTSYSVKSIPLVLISGLTRDQLLGAQVAFNVDARVWPERWDWLGWDLPYTAQTVSWTRSAGSTLIFGGYLATTPATSDINDYYLYKPPLASGTYSLMTMFYRDANRGIFDIQLGGRSVGTVDMYGSAAYNIQTVISNIKVYGSGVHDLKFVCTGKNGSSADYVFSCQGISLAKTGEL